MARKVSLYEFLSETYNGCMAILEKRLQYVGLCSLAVVQLMYYYQSFIYLGFPDGHLTELEHFRKVLFPSALLLGFGFFMLALMKAFRPSFLVAQLNVKRWLLGFITMNLLIIVIDLVAGLGLDHGRGG